MTLVTERACEHCGGPIPAGKRSDARTCSDQCRWDLNRARRAVRTNNIAQIGADSPGSAIAAVIPLPRPLAAAGWDPPGEPSRPALTAEPCPKCGNPLITGPRRTWRACGTCKMLVTPGAVRAPHQAADSGPHRQVISQRERDLEAIGLARRKGTILAQLAEMAADSRLDPRSVPVIEWLAAEVRAAASDARLDELAELAADPAAGIRRRRWWHGQPAAIIATADDYEYQDDDDQDDDDQDDVVPARPPAALAPVRPAEPTWQWAVSALGWRVSPVNGACQIIDDQPRCGADIRHGVGTHHGVDTWVCDRHYQALCRAINSVRKPA